MSRFKWLSRDAIEIIHREQIAEHGGLTGLRNENALEAALARPQHKYAYAEEDVIVLAAAYLYGIARSHPFTDGNKRTAFLATFAFLIINGYLIETDQATVVAFVLTVAAGEIDEEGCAQFLRDHTVSYPKKDL